MLSLPKRFRVPPAFRHPHFLLLPTSPEQAVVEFVAMLRERQQLQQLFRPDDVWPSAHFSLGQHEADLEWQRSEFLAKRSFAYGLWSPEREPQFWGGVYLYPSVLPEVEVELFFWKVAEAPLSDGELERELRAWLGNTWRWSAPRLPGRELPWAEWPGVTYPW
ncbi:MULTISPECIES: hypothetical protein [unclassified Aeromonas]|uniref:hypothetical protein n=1 Tax=unclassified Aeromonas TaxID=257493 RepID=UPI000FA7A03A|nr:MULTISPECIES: hypothetical protein [unclassified Aeromonas]MBV7436929.1 hypothetical protein [Aeromonas sp. sif2416]MBV7598254.1 hypothetical protein [Aeromonas sp. sia0103]